MRVSRLILWVGLGALGCLFASPSAAQYRHAVDDEMIREVMPIADSFSVKAGLPPVYTAFGPSVNGSPREVVGYVYLTSNVPPAEYGYSSRIDVLVGMDLLGIVTGIHIVNYRESLSSSRGDFLRGRGLEDQVVGKHIRESFQIGRDLDGVSGASISSRAMFRGVRNSSRRVALAYLQPSESTAPPTAGELDELNWLEMLATGYIRTLAVDRFNSGLELSFAYMGDEALGSLFMGAVRYQDVSERIDGMVGDDHVMFVGIDGSAVAGFRSNALSIRQGGELYPVPSRRVTFLGTPWEGRAAEQVVYTLIMRMDPAVDLEQPFNVEYDDRTGVPSTTEYWIPPNVLASVRERAVAAALAAAERASSTAAPTETTAAGTGSVEPTIDAPAVAPASAPGVEAVDSESTAGTIVVSSDALTPGVVTGPATESGASVSVRRETTASADGSALAVPPAPTGDLAATEADTDSEPLLDLADGSLDLSTSGPAQAAQGVGGFDFAELEDFEEETALSRLLVETRWAPVVRLLLILGLVLYAFFAKSVPVRAVTLGVTLIYLGFFDGGFLSVSHIASGLAVGPGVYLQDMALLILIGFTVVTTLLWGRVFCGFLCPFGALQDLITWIVPDRLQRALSQRVHDRAIYVKYGVLLLIAGLAATPAHIAVYQYFEPFGTVFYLSTSPLLWSIAGGFLLASAVVPRFYCRYACPLGAALGVGSLLSVFRIPRVEQCVPCKVCESACPTGAIRGPEVDFKECVRCNECEIKLLTKAGVCKHSADFVQSRLVRLETSAR
ncbi:MAG TPA: 4Fe-4S binding protein [Gemmatimonadetes bacterium]|nr:4Fe-4S binding protein [Gemmatimonadota bacterium]